MIQKIIVDFEVAKFYLFPFIKEINYKMLFCYTKLFYMDHNSVAYTTNIQIFF